MTNKGSLLREVYNLDIVQKYLNPLTELSPDCNLSRVLELSGSFFLGIFEEKTFKFSSVFTKFRSFSGAFLGAFNKNVKIMCYF